MGLKSRHRIGVDGVAAVLAIVTGFIVFAPGLATATTDEDQVRTVLDGMNGSYNRSDFDAFAAHLCSTMLAADGFKAGWFESRSADGPTRITVNSVDVMGGGDASQAVANVRFEAANREETKTLDVDFVREGAEWKACRYHAASKYA